MEIGQTTQAFGNGNAPAANPNELGKEQFLQLLTAQLNNQDPLDPMDNSEFVAQLAQFSGLEQMVNISSSVEQLAIAQAVANGSNMVGFIGKEIVYNGDGVQVDGSGSYDLAIDLDGKASEVTVSVYDEGGKLVKSLEAGTMSEGQGKVTWDGTDEQGRPVGEGSYTFKVSAKDSEGNSVNVSTRQRGVVEGVTYASGYPELVINGQRVPVGQVIEVLAAGSASPSSPEVASNASNDSNDNKEDKQTFDLPGKRNGLDRHR